MIKISVIFSTFNRARLLKNALISIQKQKFPFDLYEIIVIDNGSKDDTKNVVEELNKIFIKKIIYYYEKNPGLHNARHRGAKESNGEILVYLDDDVEVSPNLIFEVNNTFENAKVDLVGGKILPKYEINPPLWILNFWENMSDGKLCIFLSLLDFGNEIKEISPLYVFGCNFSIRKSVLFELGGFNPDSMPKELIKYRGDGESGLAKKIIEKGYKAIYNPEILIYHIITKDRLTAKYFCWRAFIEGISESFSEIRKNNRIVNDINFKNDNVKKKYKSLIKNIIKFIKNPSISHFYYYFLKIRINYNFNKGKQYHLKNVLKDKELLNYILKDNWLN